MILAFFYVFIPEIYGVIIMIFFAVSVVYHLVIHNRIVGGIYVYIFIAIIPA